MDPPPPPPSTKNQRALQHQVEQRIFSIVTAHQAALASLTSTSVAVASCPPSVPSDYWTSCSKTQKQTFSNGLESKLPSTYPGLGSSMDSVDCLMGPAARKSACRDLHGSSCLGVQVSAVSLNSAERVEPHCLLPGMPLGSGEEDHLREGDETTKVNEDQVLKAITALAVLCDEASELRRIAWTSLIPAILLFGPPEADENSATNTPQSALSGGAGNVASSSRPKARGNESSSLAAAAARLDAHAVQCRESQCIQLMGQSLHFFQGLYNFVLRCQRLVRNMVCQLAGCYTLGTAFHGETVEEGEGEELSSLLDAAQDEGTLIPLAQSIASLLHILLTVDAAIGWNATLHEAWDLYKTTVKKHSVMNSMEQPPQNEEKESETILPQADLQALERLVVQLDFSLFSSRSFLGAIEQNFDDATTVIPLRSNTVLHDVMFELIHACYDQCTSSSSTATMMGQRQEQELVGVYGLYALYRRLLPSHAIPDAKLYRKLWTMTVTPSSLTISQPSLYSQSFKSTPVLALGIGPLPFFPREFLSMYAPLSVRGCEVKPRSSYAVEYAKEWDGQFASQVEELVREALVWLSSADADLANLVSSSSSSTPGMSSVPPMSQHMNLLLDSSHASTSVHPMESIGNLLLHGLLLAHRATGLAHTLLLLHASLEMPLSSKRLSSLASLLQVSKRIEHLMCVRRREAVVLVQPVVLKLVASRVMKRLDGFRVIVDDFQSMGRLPTANCTIKSMATLSASLTTLESMLKGTSTFSSLRTYTAAVACCLCTNQKLLPSDEDTPQPSVPTSSSHQNHGSNNNKEAHFVTLALMSRLAHLANLDNSIWDACDCSFLFFHKEIFPLLVRHVRQSSAIEVERLPWILAALSDPAKEMLRQTPHLWPQLQQQKQQSDLAATPMQTAYRSYLVNEVLHEELVLPTCLAAEAALRLAIHHKTYGSNSSSSSVSVNPKQLQASKHQKQSSPCLLPLLELSPLHVGGGGGSPSCIVHLKRQVERYLERNFYNLAIITPNEVQTYVEMKVLALERYGLHLAEYGLPMGSLVQGWDLAELLQVFEEFARTFHYDIHQQAFVQRAPKGGLRGLRVITVKNISASLRQHGLSIVDQAMSASKAFIFKRLQNVAALLGDGFIKSYISREARWLQRNITIHRKESYPYNRAVSFKKEVSELLGGKGFFERVRSLVTEIGNAVGFLRLVQTAAVRECGLFASLPSRTDSDYLPLFRGERDASYEPGCNLRNSWNKKTKEACEQLERFSSSLRELSSPDNDFCQCLAKEFRNHHLQGGSSEEVTVGNFYVVLPSTTLAWIEAIVRAKDVMNKKNQTGDAYYVDDGFALGCAFALVVWGQKERFDTLRWMPTLSSQLHLMSKGEAQSTSLQTDGDAKPQSATSSFLAFFSSTTGDRIDIPQQKREHSEEASLDSDVVVDASSAIRVTHLAREAEVLFCAMDSATVFFDRM